MDHPFVTVPLQRRSAAARPGRPLQGGLATLAAALAAASLCQAAWAADKPAAKKAAPVTAEQMQQLIERLQQLEQRNAELEQQVKGLAAQQAARPTLAAPAPAAAGTTTTAASGTGTPAGGEWGQQRLVALEQQVKALVRPVQADADEGLSVEASLVAVGQQVGSKGSDSGQSQGRLNYRGDVEVGIPLGTLRSFGDARFSGFGHLRFGQGSGVSLRPTHTATVNSVPFEAGSGSDETYAIVAQAWGQLEWDLGAGRFNDLPSNRVELNLGKIDIFGFFDQNAVAGDEGAQFLNNVFVHNPLLDSGGDIAADAYGFAPGLRVAYIDEGEDRGWGWGASLGVFGSGGGANFSAAPRRPLVIGQVEFSPKQINGEPRGTYRFYAWTNGQTTDLSGESAQRHSGYGLSIDQKIGREWNLFVRWGQRTSGDGAFDKALTFGFEHGGRAWGRGSDAVGLAAGFVRTSSEWARATALDPNLVGFAADGNEQILEAYYRWKLSDHLELTPDLQWIRRAGGDGDAPAFMAVGLRAAVGF
ncbi:carbohydrate porin [Ideonella sp. DXS29W]|uniref:Carbohydrate porin n=1 Tax=Ideonella lacteola TaxID=2984193 RepID=A0ABU9BLE7_9BURK